ncbi:hypothetical protein DPMN_061424 [Dreissena polymorpha]|uniref:Uncharacterized protein n=1 Tax=Dreissena polymorpha TaxID=45954 RepID=A0A9D4C7U3_DREPO|nr:hypothetical protein DPMN_061424 [Dreissena polymorpha]
MARQRPTRRPWIDRIFIRDVQYKFELIQCRNEEVNADAGAPGLVMGPCIVEIYRIVIRDPFSNRGRRKISDTAPPQLPYLLTQFQGSSANRRTDGQTDIATISPLFLRKAWES